MLSFCKAISRVSFSHVIKFHQPHIIIYTPLRQVCTDFNSNIIELVKSSLKSKNSESITEQLNLLSATLKGQKHAQDTKLTGRDAYKLSVETFAAFQQHKDRKDVDISPVVKLLEYAHELGDNNASYTYAEFLRLGKGCTPDPIKAGSIFTDLSIKGHPYAQFTLGLMYYRGLGVEQNYNKAFTLYKVSAQNRLPQAHSILGEMYLNGQGIPQDKQEAVKCFEAAAELGDTAVHLSLAQCYNKGNGVDQSDEKSFKHYKLAADAGLVLGMYNTAVAYFSGKGVTHSFEKAAEYFQKAADKGFTAAQVNLGNMYYGGYGVDKDTAKAKELYTLAAEEDENAKALLKELEIEEQKNNEK